MIYLASPYTHNDQNIRLLRAKAAAFVMETNPKIYSPIVYGHAAESMIGKQLPYRTWITHGLDMLSRMDSIEVLKLPGWKQSEGMAVEIEYAVLNNMKIEYLDPKDIIDDKELLNKLYKT